MESLSCRGCGGSEPPTSSKMSTDLGIVRKSLQDYDWTLSLVLLATGGKFLSGNHEVSFNSISTDTRTIKKGDLFLALTGPNFDGAEFALEAAENGAGGVIVGNLPEGSELDLDIPVIQVADPLQALGDLASYRRNEMANLKVVGITGSSGKTTVKEMCSAILEQEYNVLKTQGNFNNLIGMPLSLLPVTGDHDMAVLEMGMNRPGEIARMAEIADPDIACIVNVQAAHLAGLHNVEGVAKAKGELFAGCKSWSVLCVNYDDKHVRALARKQQQDMVPYGRHRDAKVRATHVKSVGEDGMCFTLQIDAERVRIQIKAMGMHNVSNSLAAAAIAHAAGLSIEKIAKGLESFSPFDKRLQIENIGGLKVVNDCYNANPASMLAAFDTVQDMKGDHKTVAILGDMLELGEASDKAHRFLGEWVACKGFDYLLSFGEYAEIVVRGAMDASMTMHHARKLADKEEILDNLLEMINDGLIGPGDFVLVKGSRGMRMETIITRLKRELS